MNGRIIVLDGLDGSGKTTQIEMLKKRLVAEGFSFEFFHFPQYERFFGSLVGKYLKGEFGKKEEIPIEIVILLYAIDRYDVKPLIEKFLEEGKIVIMDRYLQSSLVYQSVFFEGKKKKEILEWNKIVNSKLPQADAFFYLNMPREASEQLVSSRGNVKDIHESDSAFLDNVRKTYLELAKSEKNWHVISCAVKKGKEWEIKSIQEIHEIIWKKIAKLLVLNYTLKEFAEQAK